MVDEAKYSGIRLWTDDELPQDPFELFDIWMEDARRGGFSLPEAMALSTVSRSGLPSSRMVLMKHFDPRGLVFFTQLCSRKAREIEETGHTAALFWWKELGRSIRVEGAVQPTSPQESDEYFRTRPRGSQLSAWISDQGEPIEGGRSALLARLAQQEQRFARLVGSLPRPEDWGGFRLVPTRFEFWQDRPNRLHDRFEYTLHPERSSWDRLRLQP